VGSDWPRLVDGGEGTSPFIVRKETLRSPLERKRGRKKGEVCRMRYAERVALPSGLASR